MTTSFGERFVRVPGGRVWCEVAGAGDKIPLLLLHGGPGIPSFYLEPLRALSDERPVVFYDQLGCGRSDRPDDVSLWTVARFADELVALREELELPEIHLFGHSWGAMLALEHIYRGGTGIVSLVLASPCINVDQWVADTRELIAALPPETRKAIERNEAAGTFETEEYRQANIEFAKLHISRSRPFPPEPMRRSMEQIGGQVYGTMAGPSEFTILGNLRGWDASENLHRVTMPVLWTCGRYDEALPDTVRQFSRLTPRGRCVVFEESAHMTMLDEPDLYVTAIREFINASEKARG